MFRYVAILFLVHVFSYQAMAATLRVTFTPVWHDAKQNPQGDCPYADSGDHNKYPSRTFVFAKVNDNNSCDQRKVKIIVECKDIDSNSAYFKALETSEKQSHWSDASKGHVEELGAGCFAGYYLDTAGPKFKKDGKVSSGEHIEGNGQHDVSTGDLCRVKAYLEGDTAPSDYQGDFIVGFRHKEVQPASVVGGSIEAGKEFSLGSFHFNPLGETAFSDVLLRQCEASSDPWIFWSDNDTLHRVYPTETNSTDTMPHTLKTGQNDTSQSKYNNTNCMRMFDGAINNLFTIGDNHAGCQIRVGAYDAKDGNNFTEQAAPVLKTDAAVTLSNASVMLHTGAKPATPANIENTIQVYISTNRGFTWTKSNDITQWTGQATDSGVPAAVGNTDNTRNMAMLRLTDGTSVWWRIIRGK